jgi:branched-chain amino acid aminotransferase
MPPPKGFSVTLSPYRRPTLETMPVDAKPGCLYSNNARALFHAKERGFDNAIVWDVLGNVLNSRPQMFLWPKGVLFTLQFPRACAR